ncbi:hypothetical protein [Enterococcus cecorum]|uniref:hypothetical protein n=1 Tax=Enterococcus cecorum TaxID=44008 RepID=UPI00200B3F1E|nr:hypothetical protein [Enterococcus cecorum]
MKKNWLTLLGIFTLFSLASFFWLNISGTSARLIDSKDTKTELTLSKGNVTINPSLASGNWRYIGISDNLSSIEDVSADYSSTKRAFNGDLIGVTNDGSGNEVERLLGTNPKVSVLEGKSFKNINTNDVFLQKLNYQYSGINTASCEIEVVNPDDELSKDFEYRFEVYVTGDNDYKSESYCVFNYNQNGNTLNGNKLQIEKNQKFDIKANQKVNLLIKIRALKGETKNPDENNRLLSTSIKLKLNVQNKLESK